MSIKVKYNKELLDICMERDKSIIEDNYEKITIKTKINFICKCGKQGCKMFSSIYNFGAFCKACTGKLRYEKIKSSNMEKYGVENTSQLKDVQDKIKTTNIKKYGVEYRFQANDFQDKMKATNMKKYGVEHVLQSEYFKDKVKATNIEKYGIEHVLQIKEIKDKIKATNIEKYGVEYPGQSEDVKEKMKITNMEKYGVEYVFQTEEVKTKTKATNIKKYGVEYALQSEDIKSKSKATSIEKYGVEYPIQHPEISDKSSKNSYNSKEVITPSGKLLKLQGYEPHAYKILLKTYKEKQIVNSRKKVPEIWWFDDKGKKHRYFVDFYIPKDNLMIEVKSTRTHSLGKEKIEKTLQASKEAGYKLEVWIMDQQGNILEKHLPNII